MRRAWTTYASRGMRLVFLDALRAIGVALIVVGLGSAATTAKAEETFPLDRYPGFGRSPAAALRDNTIAAWEAFRRERLTASCMARSGFDYLPVVAFPSQPLGEVARGLGVRPGAAVSQPPAERNAAYVAVLSADARERYYQALYAESASDIAATRRSGRVPAGRGAEFATGGCTGEANAAVPSIWTLKYELSVELDALGRDVARSAQIGGTGDAYAECARRVGQIDARGPADLDALAANDPSAAGAIASVSKECAQIWSSGRRVAESAALQSFERRNAAALSAARQRYENVATTIANDQDFLEYLAAYAGSS